MTYVRLFPALSSAVVLLLIMSCSDPSGVGLGVGRNPLEGGAPSQETVLPGSLRTAVSPTVTGFEGAGRNWRFLAGAVSDLGRVRADAALDFQAPTNVPASIRQAEPELLGAELRLRTTYVHGDTTAPLSLHLSNLMAEAEMDSATANQSFPPGAQIATYSASPTDSLVVLPLPDSWLQRKIDGRLIANILRDTSDTFESTFHGFRLSAPDAEAVVGFEHATASLRLTLQNENDQLTLGARKSHSLIRRTMPPSLSEDRLLIQDGVGEDLLLEWNETRLDTLQGDSLDLNQADITIPTASDPPSDSGFVRPSPSFRLTAQRRSGAPPCREVNTVSLPTAERACGIPLNSSAADGVVQVDPRTAFAIFQRRLRSDTAPLFSQYRLEVVSRSASPQGFGTTVQSGLPSTIPALTPTLSSGDNPPRIELTVTPL